MGCWNSWAAAWQMSWFGIVGLWVLEISSLWHNDPLSQSKLYLVTDEDETWTMLLDIKKSLSFYGLCLGKGRGHSLCLQLQRPSSSLLHLWPLAAVHPLLNSYQNFGGSVSIIFPRPQRQCQSVALYHKTLTLWSSLTFSVLCFSNTSYSSLRNCVLHCLACLKRYELSCICLFYWDKPGTSDHFCQNTE